uniref:Uncharacterized protein n=1 Tax=Arion vulgaris TaxID=1028688 RepID=A0A0B6YSJ7_9EUPU
MWSSSLFVSSNGRTEVFIFEHIHCLHGKLPSAFTDVNLVQDRYVFITCG